MGWCVCDAVDAEELFRRGRRLLVSSAVGDGEFSDAVYTIDYTVDSALMHDDLSLTSTTGTVETSLYSDSSSACSSVPSDSPDYEIRSVSVELLVPFYGAIAVPSVTRCRCCCCCGHRFYIAIHQVSLLSHAACAITIAGFGSSW